MPYYTAALRAPPPRYLATVLAAAYLAAGALGAVSAQEPGHHHEREHADTSARPTAHDSITHHDSTIAMHEMADTGAMPGMTMLPRPLGIPMSRMGSGTSWLPDASPMRAYHFRPDS